MTQKKSNKKAAALLEDINAVNTEVEAIIAEEAQEVVMGFATVEEAPKVETEFDTDELALPDNYFGKGEFAITKKNIEKLIFAVKEYNEKNIWCWKLADQLGINRNGKLSKKFTDATDTLIEIKVPQVELLFAEMLNVKPKEESEIIYDRKPSTIDKSIRREEVKLLLTSVEGLTEVEINRMVKAI